MLNYTSLFADLEELFQSAGRDPDTFQRLAREVDHIGENLQEYYQEVACDYVVRLQQRLNQPDSTLSPEEIEFLRAFLGLAPADQEREERLVSELACLEENLAKLLLLKDRPLNLKNLDGLRRLLGRMQTSLPRIVEALAERREQERFLKAVGDGGETMDRKRLLRTLHKALAGIDTSPSTPSEETSGSLELLQ